MSVVKQYSKVKYFQIYKIQRDTYLNYLLCGNMILVRNSNRVFTFRIFWSAIIKRCFNILLLTS